MLYLLYYHCNITRSYGVSFLLLGHLPQNEVNTTCDLLVKEQDIKCESIWCFQTYFKNV